MLKIRTIKYRKKGNLLTGNTDVDITITIWPEIIIDPPAAGFPVWLAAPWLQQMLLSVVHPAVLSAFPSGYVSTLLPATQRETRQNKNLFKLEQAYKYICNHCGPSVHCEIQSLRGKKKNELSPWMSFFFLTCFSTFSTALSFSSCSSCFSLSASAIRASSCLLSSWASFSWFSMDNRASSSAWTEQKAQIK